MAYIKENIFFQNINKKDWRNCTAVRVVALHIANTGLILV